MARQIMQMLPSIEEMPVNDLISKGIPNITAVASDLDMLDVKKIENTKSSTSRQKPKKSGG